jgi:hypothetical protein
MSKTCDSYGGVLGPMWIYSTRTNAAQSVSGFDAEDGRIQFLGNERLHALYEHVFFEQTSPFCGYPIPVHTSPDIIYEHSRRRIDIVSVLRF